MIIVHRPPALQAFFASLRPALSRPQFQHLWAVLLAWVVNMRRSVLFHLTRSTGHRRHRTCLGRFLSTAPWDAPALLDQQVLWTLHRMRPRPGEALDLILDDTRIGKRGRKMYGVGRIWIPTEGRFTYGHVVVTAALLFRGVIMPWRFDLWIPRHRAGRAYRKSTQIAAEFIRAFQPPTGLRVRVLFDAFYLTPAVVRACQDRGFTWFSVASKNRTLARAGQRRRLCDLAPGLLKHAGLYVHMPRARGRARFRIACADGRLKGIGPVRMVVRKRPGESNGRITAIVTNDRRLPPRTIAAIYERRWRIEELFKELRSDLGLGEYQVISQKGILHHLHLCGLVHLLLTHHSMEAVGAQARKANREISLPPMSHRLESLRQLIREDQIGRILAHEHDYRKRKRLQRYLWAA